MESNIRYFSMCSNRTMWCCQVCGQWVQQLVTCPVCQAINYCGQSHRKRHWGQCHNMECNRMKQQVARRNVLSDFPFDFMQQTTQQVETGEATYCKFLSLKGLHMQGIWKAECGCHQEHCESAEFHVTSCNIDMQVQDMAMLSLSQWQDYYHVKKLSFDDPVALILDMPMTLMWAVRQAREFFQDCSISSNHIVIHYLGAQKELHQWPVFRSLLDTLPHRSVHIHFVSPDITDDMNGSSKWTSVQQGGWVSGLCADASNQVDSSSAAVVTDLPIQQSDDQQATAHSEAVDVAASTPHCCSALHTTDRSQQGACTVPEQAADAPADAKQSTRTLQLTFHKGLYHDVMRQSNCGASVADLVFGANAGLAAYASWVPTLQLLSHKGSPPAVFTDFCEEAAVQGLRAMQAVVGKSMHWMPISINPFRKPLSCQGRDNNLPSFSNAFIFGMAPQAQGI